MKAAQNEPNIRDPNKWDPNKKDLDEGGSPTEFFQKCLQEEGISVPEDPGADGEGDRIAQHLQAIVDGVNGNRLALQVLARRARWMGLAGVAVELNQDPPRLLFAADPEPSPLSRTCQESWARLSSKAKRVCLALAIIPRANVDRLRATLKEPEAGIQELDDQELLVANNGELGSGELSNGALSTGELRLEPVFAAWAQFASSDEVVEQIRHQIDRWLLERVRTLARRQSIRGDDDSRSALEKLAGELEVRLDRGIDSSELRLVICNGLSCHYRVRSDAVRYQKKLRRHMFDAVADPAIPLADRLIAACELGCWGGTGEKLDKSRAALHSIEPELETEEDRAIWASARADLATSEHDFEASTTWRKQALNKAEEAGDPLWLSRELINHGVTCYWVDRTDQALESFRKAEWYATRHGARRLSAIAAGNLALICGRRGDVVPAIEHGERALGVFESLQDKRAAANALMHLGLFQLNANQLKEARRCLETASQRMKALQDAMQEALVWENLADVLLELGDLDGCRQALEQSRLANSLTSSPSPHIEAHNQMLTGLLAAREGRTEEGMEILGALKRRTGRALQYFVEGRFYLCVLALNMGDAAKANAALDGMNMALDALSEPMHRHLSALLGHLSKVQHEEPARNQASDTPADNDPESTLVHLLVPFLIPTGTGRYHNVLLVRRLLSGVSANLSLDARRRALLQASSVSPPALGLDAEHQVVVFAEASQSSAGAAGPTIAVDLSSRTLLWNLLNALVEAGSLNRGGGSSLSVEQLQEKLWPGERIQPDAAANRVYNAVALLRRRGLAPLLEKDDGGYRIVGGTAVVYLDPQHWTFQHLPQDGSGTMGTLESQ